MSSQTVSYDVIVIGAGVEGSSSAYQLAKQGKKVLLLEQFPLPHSRGSSGGHSRVTRYAYNDPFYVHMMTDCFPMWETLSKEAQSDFFVQCGTIDLRQSGTESEKVLTQALRKHHVPHEVLSPSELRERFPMLEPDTTGVGAVWDSLGGILKADKCLAAFQKMFQQFGGVIRTEETVTALVPGDQVTVVTSKSVYTAGSVVIAAGPWAGKFTKELGLDLPLQPIRISVLYWSPLPGKEDLHKADKMPCLLDSRDRGQFRIYALPSDEYSNLVKVCLHMGPEIDPDLRDRPDRQWVKDRVREFMKGLFPGLRTDKPAIEETCVYTMTPDHNPYIDRHPKFSNIIICAGFSGHGFKLAPAVGKAVTELVLGQPPSYNMEPFKVDRFSPKSNL